MYKIYKMEQKLEELLENLFNLKYNWTAHSGGNKYTSDVIAKDGRLAVQEIIRKFVNENRDNEIGILRAKVFMYEEIISKSNFAPLISSVKSELDLKNHTETD
jgi:hypothetical protein